MLFQILPVRPFGFRRIARLQEQRAQRMAHRNMPERRFVIPDGIFQDRRLLQRLDCGVEMPLARLDLARQHQPGNPGQFDDRDHTDRTALRQAADCLSQRLILPLCLVEPVGSG